jgi:hypothetical protein
MSSHDPRVTLRQLADFIAEANARAAGKILESSSRSRRKCGEVLRVNAPHDADETKAVVERVASEHNLSPADFISVAIAQSLARSLKDPYLENRAARAEGSGFRAFLDHVPDVPPVPGDELPE